MKKDTDMHYPRPESITCHPLDRPHLDMQLPRATVYGQPLPGDLTIIEDHRILPGTLRLRIQDADHTVTLGARWLYADPITGRPLTNLTPE